MPKDYCLFTILDSCCQNDAWLKMAYSVNGSIKMCRNEPIVKQHIYCSCLSMHEGCTFEEQDYHTFINI